MATVNARLDSRRADTSADADETERTLLSPSKSS
jgi:hypothetical protein